MFFTDLTGIIPYRDLRLVEMLRLSIFVFMLYRGSRTPYWGLEQSPSWMLVSSRKGKSSGGEGPVGPWHRDGHRVRSANRTSEHPNTFWSHFVFFTSKYNNVWITICYLAGAIIISTLQTATRWQFSGVCLEVMKSSHAKVKHYCCSFSLLVNPK